MEGSAVNLVCEAMAGDVPISYSWTGPDGVALPTNATISVIFSASEDYEEYICTASNEVGLDRAIAVVPGGMLCLSMRFSIP